MSVRGDFNDWVPGGAPLVRDEKQGCFEVILPLEPGRYEYQLLVDGEPGPDPFALEQVESGEGTTRSVLEIHAPTRP